MHSVRAGDRIDALGFAGAYVLPETIEADHILHLCAGSGSVPNVSMVKDALIRHATLRHTFVYSNKTCRTSSSARRSPTFAAPIPIACV